MKTPWALKLEKSIIGSKLNSFSIILIVYPKWAFDLFLRFKKKSVSFLIPFLCWLSNVNSSSLVYRLFGDLTLVGGTKFGITSRFLN